MDNPQVTLAWLAGFIDGEGCFQFHVQLRRHNELQLEPLLMILNTEFELIEECGKILKELGASPYFYKVKSKGKNKETLRVIIRKQSHLVKIIPPLLPFFKGKKKQLAKLIFKFCSNRIETNKWNSGRGRGKYTSEEIDLAKQVFELNARGTSETLRKSTQILDEWKIKSSY